MNETVIMSKEDLLLDMTKTLGNLSNLIESTEKDESLTTEDKIVYIAEDIIDLMKYYMRSAVNS